MKIKIKVYMFLGVLCAMHHTQTGEIPSEKLPTLYSSSLSKTLYYVCFDAQPSRKLTIVDFVEPYMLKKVGYSHDEIYNRMISERMFALSIAAVICTPAITPIAMSLCRVLYDIYFDAAPLTNLTVTDSIEPYMLKKAGYSHDEIYNRMISERMFAFSIAAVTYKPGMIHIALSLHSITSTKEKTWAEYKKHMATKIAIEQGLKKIIA